MTAVFVSALSLFAQKNSQKNHQKEITDEIFTEASEAFEFNVLNIDEQAVVSAQEMNSAITENSRIYVQNGQLYSNGQRFKIFGLNISDIPTRRMADATAKNLAQRGFNAVRFYNIDSDAEGTLVKKLTNGTRITDYSRLDEFDYFVAQLKRYGIYLDIPLMAERVYEEADGFPKGTSALSDYKSIQTLAFFNDTAKFIQKDWIIQFLNHVNPYTKYAYKDEPALAVIEVMTKTGLMNSYFNNGLAGCTDNIWIGLENKWNKWLKERGETFASMEEKYNYAEPSQNSLVTSKSSFKVNSYQGAKAKVSKKDGIHTITIKTAGKDAGDISYSTGKLSFTSDETYTISFSAKAANPCNVSVTLNQNHAPWQALGFGASINLEEDWKTFTFKVLGVKTDTNARLSIGNMGLLEGNKITFRDFIIVKGGGVDNIREGLRSGRIHFPTYEEFAALPDNIVNQDFRKLVTDFLYETETAYWKELSDFIKKENRARCLLMGTQCDYAPYGTQEIFDIVDTQAVFNDAVNTVIPEGVDYKEALDMYYVKNSSLAGEADGNVLTRTAAKRVYGKPFSVSAIDHPYPNQYAAEMYPMWSVYACLQDWDCIWFSSADSIPLNTEERNRISSPDDNLRNPVKAASAPVCARIFRNSLIKPAFSSVYMNLSDEAERVLISQKKTIGLPVCAEEKNFAYETGLVYKIGIAWNGKTPLGGMNIDEMSVDIAQIKKNISDIHLGLLSDNGQVYWNPGIGVFAATYLNAYVFIGDSKGVNQYRKSSNSLVIDQYNFTPLDGWACVAIARKSETTDLGFLASWSGNTMENLHVYGHTESVSDELKDFFLECRENVNLTTNKNLGFSPAMTMGAYAAIETPYEWTFTWLLPNGKEDTDQDREEITNLWYTDKGSKSLWFKVKK